MRIKVTEQQIVDAARSIVTENVAQKKTFTAFDVTKQLRQECGTGIYIGHYDTVKPAVHDFMIHALALGLYETEDREYSGNWAVTYVPKDFSTLNNANLPEEVPTPTIAMADALRQARFNASVISSPWKFTTEDSSWISEVKYDTASQVLTIIKKDGGVFGFSNVPEHIFQDFRKEAFDGSAGGFYHSNIIGIYNAVDVVK